MGIQGFQTFQTTVVPDGVVKLHMLDEIDKWKG